jgi:GTP-binding protein YchF
MFSIGIVGLPNVGKSTLFSALTQKKVPIAPYPFTTIEPNKGIVSLPDKRLEKLAEILKPEKVTPVFLEFIDIAGLVRNAHLGEGLGCEFLSHIQEVDLILEVVRLFENEKVSHTEKTIDPKRDIEIIKNEILARDKKIVLKRKKEFFKDEIQKEAIEKIQFFLENGLWLKDEAQKLPSPLNQEVERISKALGLLSIKPIFYLFNINLPEQKNLCPPLPQGSYFFLNAEEEREIQTLSQKEIEELSLKSCLDELILACYNKLELITFYTIKGKEVRANEIKKGSTIFEAAGKIHSDFQKNLKKAEVISFEDFLNCQNWSKCKEDGKIKIKGHQAEVEDGEIIEFKI